MQSHLEFATVKPVITDMFLGGAFNFRLKCNSYVIYYFTLTFGSFRTVELRLSGRQSSEQLPVKQCTYHVTLRSVCEPLLPWKSNICFIFLCVCVRACVRKPGRQGVCMRIRACILAYPACNKNAPYCDVICGFSVFTTLLTLSHKQWDFRKNVIEHQTCVVIFSTTFI
jgi:hypothetical protein